MLPSALLLQSGGRGESCGEPNCYARAPLTNCSLSTAKVMAGQGAEQLELVPIPRLNKSQVPGEIIQHY